MKLKITILTNDPNTWMAKHIPHLVKKLRKKHLVRVCFDVDKIKKGDVLFILSVYKLIPEKILKLNHHNIVIHASALPRGKGWSPATWQILEGKNKIPISLFEADSKVDSGIVYLKSTLELQGNELLNNWQDSLGKKINEMVLEFIKNYGISGKNQKGKETFYPKRTPEDSALDVKKSIKEQFNLLRVVDNENYPAFFIYKGKKYILKIYDSEEK